MIFENDVALENALRALGTLLTDRGLDYTIALVGGGSLMLLGLLGRPTKDLDIVALYDGEYRRADPLPDSLREAITDTASALDLPADWLNAGPTQLMDLGLPEGAAERVEVRRYGALEVHLLERRDQIALKLYAAADHPPGSKHHADLQVLAPTPDELMWSASWARTHDPSETFLDELRAVLASFGVDLAETDLQ